MRLYQKMLFQWKFERKRPINNQPHEKSHIVLKTRLPRRFRLIRPALRYGQKPIRPTNRRPHNTSISRSERHRARVVRSRGHTPSHLTRWFRRNESAVSSLNAGSNSGALCPRTGRERSRWRRDKHNSQFARRRRYHEGTLWSVCFRNGEPYGARDVSIRCVL